MNAGEIHINEVLALIETVAEDGSQYTFSIDFVRDRKGRSGPKGSIKHIPLARKGVRTSRRNRKRKGSAPTPEKWQFKKYGGIPIIDINTDELITPKFTHIIGFNGQKVRHYGK